MSSTELSPQGAINNENSASNDAVPMDGVATTDLTHDPKDLDLYLPERMHLYYVDEEDKEKEVNIHNYLDRVRQQVKDEVMSSMQKALDEMTAKHNETMAKQAETIKQLELRLQMVNMNLNPNVPSANLVNNSSVNPNVKNVVNIPKVNVSKYVNLSAAPQLSQERKRSHASANSTDNDGFTTVSYKTRKANQFSQNLSNAVSGTKPSVAHSSPADKVTELPQPKVRPIHITIPDNKFKFLKDLSKNVRCKFTTKNAGDQLKIQPESTDGHRELTAYFEKTGHPHFLLPERTNPPLKVVIRNLPADSPIGDIHDELSEMKFEILKVVQMTSFRTGKVMPLFQVQLTKNELSEKIYEVRRLLTYGVVIETYRNPIRTMQCFKCQYFHHRQENCRMNPRCVRCTGEHASADCPLGTAKIENPVCCNCGEAHAASFRGCQKFPQRRAPVSTTRTVTPNFSYAAAAKPQTSEANMSPSATMDIQAMYSMMSEMKNFMLNLSAQVMSLVPANSDKNTEFPLL